MRIVVGLALISTALSAQSTARLDSDLRGLADPNAPLAAIATRVADDILALADKDAQPSRRTALDFAIELSKAVSTAREGSSQARLQAVTSAVLDVLQSSGTPSYRFHSAVDTFRDQLLAMKATPEQAKSAANRLMILGQEVRGPDGIKLQLLR